MLNPGCKILGFFQQEKRELHSRTCPLKKANAASGNENGCVKLRAHAYKLDVYHCVNQNEIFTLLTSSIVHAKWKERGCWDTFAGLHLIGLQEYRVKWNDGRSVYTIRDFKIRERRRRRTSLKKRNSHYLNLHRDYSYSLALSNAGELSSPLAPPPPPKKRKIRKKKDNFVEACSFIEREIQHFHVVVMQWRKRNVQTICDTLAELFVSLLKLLLFLLFFHDLFFAVAVIRT